MLSLGTTVVLFIAGAAMDVGYEGLYQTNADIITPSEQKCFDIRGLPSSILGTYIIGGPAIFEYGGQAFTSVLDGFGKINRIEIRNGHACFATNMLQSSFWNSSIKAGHIAPGALFTETKPPRKCPFYNPACDMMAKSDNNWVNSVHLSGGGDKIILLSDTTTMIDYDISSMTVSGVHKFDDHMTKLFEVNALGSAHPHTDGHGGFIEFGVESGISDYVDIYTVDPSDPRARRLMARYSSKSSPYLHSFGVTANYAVIPHNINLEMAAMLESDGLLSKAMKGSFEGVNVVKLERAGASAPSDAITFHPNPFYHVHVVNSFENASGVVFDVSTYQDTPFSGPMTDIGAARTKSVRDAEKLRGVIKRYHFGLVGDQKGVATEEVLSLPGRTTDFPKINQNFAGKPYCIYYAVEWFHDDRTFGSMAVLKHNLCTGTRTYWFREDWYPSEAIFVPNGIGESEGVLLLVVLNGRMQTSHFVVADATDMHTLAEFQLPVRIPFTGHAEFFQGVFSSVRGVANTSDATIVI